MIRGFDYLLRIRDFDSSLGYSKGHNNGKATSKDMGRKGVLYFTIHTVMDGGF